MSFNIKSIKEEFKRKGIFYTPPELAELIKSYAKQTPKNVYDPTCGDGGLLAVFDDDIVKYGQEINADQLEVAKERLVNFNGYCGDTLKDPYFLDMKFDCIVANPPFSIEWEPKIDVRFEDSPTIPTKGKADYAFLLHIIYYLSNDGIAVTLNFPGIAYRGNREQQIRKWIVEQNYIDRVVHIPGDTFVDTKISTILIVFKKNKTTTDIIFEDKEKQKEVVVSKMEIAKNDYNLSVSNYIADEIVTQYVDPVELQQKAREQMYSRLKKDIEFDLAVCEFENFDKAIYLNNLISIIESYKEK